MLFLTVSGWSLGKDNTPIGRKLKGNSKKKVRILGKGKKIKKENKKKKKKKKKRSGYR